MSPDLKQPFAGRHLVNRRLTGSSSNKITRHHEISLGGSGVTYQPGDALGILPEEDPALVERLIAVLGATGDEPVPGADGTIVPLRLALSRGYNLSTPSRRLFERLIERGATDLAPLLDRANAEQFKKYVGGWNEAHDVLDMLEAHRPCALTPAELVGALRKGLPRLYSIASSLAAHPDEVHLLVVAVNYSIRGRERLGVCSTWLGERWPVGASAEMYLQNQQKHFALPEGAETPIVMVGPGTGLAPFRAFLEERRITGAPGRNWLFFGEQQRVTDFFYEDELTAMTRDGFLRLDAAFSRDQAHKVYVQHRMRDAARDLWAWLEDGAAFYVCGDKERMAADVDRELHRIIETEGGRTPDQAREYVSGLRKSRRYQRDVY
jgi:sulfite reductase (NADPH) flavoprotein alpha-component